MSKPHNAGAAQFATATGLRVRTDLYDEAYSDADYESMLSMYEGTMAQIEIGRASCRERV